MESSKKRWTMLYTGWMMLNPNYADGWSMDCEPEAVGSAYLIKGPRERQTLVKDGISKILGREFAFIALGGATDSSFLEGHSYTYEGSSWGKIIDILIQCKSMNPVIYFDELDKVGTQREEIMEY